MSGSSTVVAGVGGFLVLVFATLACEGSGANRSDGPGGTLRAAGSPALVTVDPTTTFQTMTGWEGSAAAGQTEVEGFEVYRNELYDRVVGELGIDRLRLNVRGGAENPTDYFTQMLNGQISAAEWRTVRYQIINDNDDPQSVDGSGFQFSELDHHVDNVVLPIKQRVEGSGEKLFVDLDYIDFGSGSSLHKSDPQEYAELIVAAFDHLRSKYGWVPDGVEICLEADNAGWSGAQLGAALVAAESRLSAHGYHPTFVAPSDANMQTAISHFDDLIQVPGALEHLTTFAYHRYGGATPDNLQAIADRAARYGVQTAMLEHIGADYRELHQDLKIGMNSSWHQFTLAYAAPDNGAQYYVIENPGPNPTVVMGSRTRFLRQYFRYIRRGAVRIGALSTDPLVDPLAFRNANGKIVVVVKVDAGGPLAITGLPPGDYGVSVVTGAVSEMLPDLPVGVEEGLETTIPAAGVITIFAR